MTAFSVQTCGDAHALLNSNRGTKEERAEERDEQWEAQQAVLERRRGNSWQDVSMSCMSCFNIINCFGATMPVACKCASACAKCKFSRYALLAITDCNYHEKSHDSSELPKQVTYTTLHRTTLLSYSQDVQATAPNLPSTGPPYTQSMCSVITSAWLWLQGVEARRAEVRKYAGDPAYKKKVDEERRAKKKAEVQDPCQPPQVNMHACHAHHLRTCCLLVNTHLAHKAVSDAIKLAPTRVVAHFCLCIELQPFMHGLLIIIRISCLGNRVAAIGWKQVLHICVSACASLYRLATVAQCMFLMHAFNCNAGRCKPCSKVRHHHPNSTFWYA